MTILGYDINGQPLRAGDRVVMVISKGAVPNGVELTVIGPCRDSKALYPLAAEWEGMEWFTEPHRLRKLPPKQADNETTTWESIEQLTGWVPEGVRV